MAIENSSINDASANCVAVTVSELRSRLAAMIDRAARGEEVLISRGRVPVAKLVPLAGTRRRRLGALKDILSDEALATLVSALDEPLSPQDQAALEGHNSDSCGIAKR